METPTQFDLNDAVRRWREVLATSPAFRGENLDELEVHVRDGVDALVAKGLSPEEALLIARRRVGSPEALGAEFGKVNRDYVWLTRGLWILGGMLGIGLMNNLASAVTNVLLLTSYSLLPEHLQGAEHCVALLGWVGAAGQPALLLALLGLGWRLGRRETGGFVRLRAWSLARPFQAGVSVAAVLLLVSVLLGLCSGPLLALTLGAKNFSLVAMPRTISSTSTYVLLWPALLTWLLFRLRRTATVAP
jgi:hypothetical protein